MRKRTSITIRRTEITMNTDSVSAITYYNRRDLRMSVAVHILVLF